MVTNFFKSITYRILSHFLWMRPYYLFKKMAFIESTVELSQLNLINSYKLRKDLNFPLPSFDEVEFSVYSENGEDGILLYLFSILGTTNKKVVEICCGDGIQNCSTNLIVNHGWTGYLFDGNKSRIEIARAYFSSNSRTKNWPPVIAHEWILPSTINETLTKYNAVGEVDLLSLDLDGLDYWVWKAIKVIQPRVLICEFNNLWPADKALTVPADENFRAEYNSKFGADFSGATLGAFVKAGKEKGYRLVGGQRYGYNAVFVKNGIGDQYFPEVEPATLLNHPYAIHARTFRNNNIKNKNWVEV